MRFARPRKILLARSAGEVAGVVAEAQNCGGYAAGFVAYEAAPAFDSAHRTHAPSSPLAWFAVFDSPPEPAELPPPSAHMCGRWRAGTNKAEYFGAVGKIQKLIAAGEAYQVNLTYPLRARFAGCPLSFFAALCARQPSPWRFFAETEEWAVCSASPECFFELRGGVLSSRPMKGTRRASLRAAANLAASPKDRAENLMIVDMVRNDMARIPGAQNIRAEPLLAVEEYPTVAQMTSTVSCETGAGAGDIFAALFPCASVTGAPKIAAMKIIRALEKTPRGVYCGACGWLGGGAARFNVAIRTAFIDKKAGAAEYGAGGGIVADSSADSEWRECRSKAAILSPPEPPYLIETMRAEDGKIALLPRHLARMAKSARWFGFRFRGKEAELAALEKCAAVSGAAVLRLCLGADGKLRAEIRCVPESQKVRAVFAPGAVCSSDALLRHKTSQRAVYENARNAARARGYEDAVLQNERGEVTETCVANIAARIGGGWWTPPESSGLLPGVFRAAMLAENKLRERVLYADDLRHAESVCRINAVRGMEEISVE